MKDTGCELASSCLGCPLTDCKDDVPRSLSLQRRRNKQIRELAGEKSVAGLARQFNLSERTIQRVLRR